MMAPTRGFAHQQRQPQCQQPQQQQQQQQQQHEEQQEAKQQQQEQQQQQRLLSVAVVGLPNAGKSTLVNRLAGTKISGVSSKRNTTIDPQLGAFTTGDCQV
jgi:tRNA U34 5-carboxymethylaminomethyl modifying GTPase MnmE/TrmE